MKEDDEEYDLCNKKVRSTFIQCICDDSVMYLVKLFYILVFSIK